MNLSERLNGVRRIFLDTAPVVYFVEENPHHATRAQGIFERLDGGELSAVASPVTLAECLVLPYRSGNREVAEAFTRLLANSESVSFRPIDWQVADKAADLRARYHLTLTDALQVAVALLSGCDAFLTNDATLKRVKGLNVIVLDEIEALAEH
jgi:predicted nucleic acid-binding protein